MDKELLDSMFKDSLISDEAYHEVLKDINIVEELNAETTELKKELIKIKKHKSIFDLDQIIYKNLPIELNFNM